MSLSIKKAAILGAGLLALAAPLRLSAYGAAGAAAAPYLKLPMGARGTGMGEAFSGIADDISAIYYNAAGLTALDSAQLQLMHIEGFGGVRYENLGLAVPAESVGLDVWGTIGFSYTLVAIDDIPRTEANPDGSFNQAYADRGFMFTSGASVITASYAWQATKLYSVGATFKAINEKVDTSSGWGLAGDIGLLTRPEVLKGLSAGLTLQNVGTSPSSDASLPISMRVGLGYQWDYPFTKETWDDRWIFGADVIAPIVPVDGVWHLNLGTEYLRWFDQYFGALRLGFRTPTDLGGLASLTAGGGVGTELPGVNLSLDYAWVPYGELGNMNRVAVTAAFGGKPRKRPKGDKGGFYLYPPPNVQVTGGDRRATISWEAQKGRLDGYNLYMSYNPGSGQWTRLNKLPIVGTSQTINSLYNGYKIYFCVSTLALKPGQGNLYQESDKSPSVVITPMGSGAAASAAVAPAAPALPSEPVKQAQPAERKSAKKSKSKSHKSSSSSSTKAKTKAMAPPDLPF